MTKISLMNGGHSGFNLCSFLWGSGWWCSSLTVSSWDRATFLFMRFSHICIFSSSCKIFTGTEIYLLDRLLPLPMGDWLWSLLFLFLHWTLDHLLMLPWGWTSRVSFALCSLTQWEMQGHVKPLPVHPNARRRTTLVTSFLRSHSCTGDSSPLEGLTLETSPVLLSLSLEGLMPKPRCPG